MNIFTIIYFQEYIYKNIFARIYLQKLQEYLQKLQEYLQKYI